MWWRCQNRGNSRGDTGKERSRIDVDKRGNKFELFCCTETAFNPLVHHKWDATVCVHTHSQAHIWQVCRHSWKSYFDLINSMGLRVLCFKYLLVAGNCMQLDVNTTWQCMYACAVFGFVCVIGKQGKNSIKDVRKKTCEGECIILSKVGEQQMERAAEWERWRQTDSERCINSQSPEDTKVFTWK